MISLGVVYYYFINYIIIKIILLFKKFSKKFILGYIMYNG